MAKIAFLGMGNMGAPMARRLMGAGHSLVVWNRSPGKAEALRKDGAVVAATPKAAAEAADAIFSMVTDDKASRSVWAGPEGALAGALKPGAFAVESSTVSNGWVMELAGLARAKGLRFMDAAVAGRPDVIADGKLLVYVGGSAADVAAARPLLDALGRKVMHFGAAGMGNAFKLIYNVMGAIHVAALAEGMQACEAAGIDLAAAAEAFSIGNTGSGHVVRHSKYMATGRHESPVGFSARNRIKDIMYGVEYIERVGGQSRIGRTAADVFGQSVENGLGDSNDSELIDALRKVHARKA